MVASDESQWVISYGELLMLMQTLMLTLVLVLVLVVVFDECLDV